ncbi:MAG: hypothetical protein HY520_01305 [Candidatus Aenigmarchaeota archaeon]|nr:hypothetical protein [Candidatus Aenigmarchaeota archaeon]
MADNRTASLLSLVGGILVILGGVVVAAIGGALMPLPFVGSILIAVAIVGIIFGALMVYGSTLLGKKGQEKTGAIVVLVFSILSLIVGGGFIIGFILGLVGAILALKK